VIESHGEGSGRVGIVGSNKGSIIGKDVPASALLLWVVFILSIVLF
jgi:hypothetical protein